MNLTHRNRISELLRQVDQLDGDDGGDRGPRRLPENLAPPPPPRDSDGKILPGFDPRSDEERNSSNVLGID
jgi:hypothetical protein